MLEEYFEPVESKVYDLSDTNRTKDCFGNSVTVYTERGKFPDLSDMRTVIFGISDDRGSLSNKGCAGGADQIRKKLYALKNHWSPVAVADLGNLRPGLTLEDTYAAIATVTSELMQENIIPFIIGGGHDLTYGHYSGYKKLEQIINIVSVDSSFDLGIPEDELHSESYIGKIIIEQPNYLFNYSNIGYQSYLTGRESTEMMKQLYFDALRLGQAHENIEETEPVVRNADLLTFDISAIRQGDAPGNRRASPNGFYGEEACQVMMYAGASDKLSGAGLYEYNPSLDINGQTAHLAAQMIWYFIEGLSMRKSDIPSTAAGNYITYRVAVDKPENEIVFIKSVRTDRWWMKLPADLKRNRFLSQHLLPCSYRDYQQACSNEVPDRWWNALQKLV